MPRRRKRLTAAAVIAALRSATFEEQAEILSLLGVSSFPAGVPYPVPMPSPQPYPAFAASPYPGEWTYPTITC